MLLGTRFDTPLSDWGNNKPFTLWDDVEIGSNAKVPEPSTFLLLFFRILRNDWSEKEIKIKWKSILVIKGRTGIVLPFSCSPIKRNSISSNLNEKINDREYKFKLLVNRAK